MSNRMAMILETSLDALLYFMMTLFNVSECTVYYMPLHAVSHVWHIIAYTVPHAWHIVSCAWHAAVSHLRTDCVRLSRSPNLLLHSSALSA